MTEEEELIEEAEARMAGDNNALIRVLESRIDKLKGAVNFDALERAPEEQRERTLAYMRRLETKYYAALQRHAAGG